MSVDTIKYRVTLQEINGYVNIPGRETFNQNQVTLADAVTAIDAAVGSVGLTVYNSISAERFGLNRSVVLEFDHPIPNVDIYQIIRGLV